MRFRHPSPWSSNRSEDSSFVAAGAPSQHTLFTPLPLGLPSVSPKREEAKCQVYSTKDGDNNDVCCVVVAVASLVETQRHVDNAQDNQANTKEHVNLADDSLVAATEEKVMDQATQSLDSEKGEKYETDNLMSCVVFVLFAVC